MAEEPASDAVAKCVASGGHGEEEVEKVGFGVEGDEEGEEEDVDVTLDKDFMLLLEGELNPLDFLEEDDVSAVELPHQFERLDYEVLAERKRKRIADSNGESTKKSREDESASGSIDDFWELIGGPKRRRKSRKAKRRGRPKGSKNKFSPEITRKLGDATLHYASGNYDEAITLLVEVIKLAPCTGDAFHTLGLVYDALGDRKKAFNFYMLAASLTAKDPSLWKLLTTWSIEQGNAAAAIHCISKAITADPEDISLRLNRASLYVELECYKKAAESYYQILGLDPDNDEACKMAAILMYRKCGQVDRAISILEDYIKCHNSVVASLGVLNLLVSIHMENDDHLKACEQLKLAQSAFCSGKEFPLHLSVKTGICEAHLGNMDRAENLFLGLQRELAEEQGELINEVAASLMKLGYYEAALKYFHMLEGSSRYDNGPLHLNIAKCYISLNERSKAIAYFHKVLSMMESIDARIALASILFEDEKDDEAINLLSATSDKASQGSPVETDFVGPKPWWLDGRVRLMLARIYQRKKMFEAFVDTILPCTLETLFIEDRNQKVKSKKKLGRKVLYERVKVLDDHQVDSVFRGFRPIAPRSDLHKASRAKKLLQKMEATKKERKAAALAAGLDWQSDDSDDEYLGKQSAFREPPLPKLLKDDEHYQLIVDLCKALATLRRYWEALQVINRTLSLACNTFSLDKKEELRSLAAQIAYNMSDPINGYDNVRYIVRQHPYSLAAWNCYYKVATRLESRLSKHAKLLNSSMRRKNHAVYESSGKFTENQRSIFQQNEATAKEYLEASKVQEDGPRNESRLSKHGKFLRNIRSHHADCIPPVIIAGHQFSMTGQHQAAAKEYLEAYKLQPDNPFINLCAGTALINLALGFRLQNKHRTVIQGFAFLHNCLRLCPNSQEALYNIARAYQQVGLVTLAALYYEKVLAIHQKDYPIPKLPNEDPSSGENPKPGYCNLQMEAAYNLHLIYKRSGALDLARQVLKDFCRP